MKPKSIAILIGAVLLIFGAVYAVEIKSIEDNKRENKEAADAGQAISDSIFGSVTSALEAQADVVGAAKAGTVKNVRATMRDVGLETWAGRFTDAMTTGNNWEGIMTDLGNDTRYGHLVPDNLQPDQHMSFIGQLATSFNRNLGILNRTIDHTANNVSKMSVVFEKDNEGINEMAAATDTELFSATAGFGWMAKSLSGALVNDARQMSYAQADRTANIQQGLRQYGKGLVASKSFDEAAQSIRNIVQGAEGGVLSDDDKISVTDELANMFRYSQDLTGSTTGGARAMNELFGNMPDGQIFGANQMLEGMGRQLMTIPAFAAAIRANAASVKNQRFDVAEVIQSQLLKADMMGARGHLISRTDLLSQIKDEDMQKLENSGLLEKNAFFDENGNILPAQQIQAMLSREGITLSLTEMTPEMLMGPQDKFEGAVADFVDAVNLMITK